MNPLFILIVVFAGLFIGGGIFILWNGKSPIKKPKWKGHKREYYTKGEIIRMQLRAWWVNFKSRGVH
jgi:hypothetical protein